MWEAEGLRCLRPSEPKDPLRRERLKEIEILYYAQLREKSGVDREVLSTAAATVSDLYDQLSEAYGLDPRRPDLRVAVNDEMVDWQAELASGDRVVFLTPFGGG
jgi:molybdopterin synthase sulfur carrier subunit